MPTVEACPRCPICKDSAIPPQKVYDIGYSEAWKTADFFWDEAGEYHMHWKRIIQTYMCHLSHTWQNPEVVFDIAPCIAKGCDYGRASSLDAALIPQKVAVVPPPVLPPVLPPVIPQAPVIPPVVLPPKVGG